MKYFTVENREFYTNGRLIKLCGLVNAWYESIENPEVLIDSLKQHQEKKHIFTFFQRPPNTEPNFKYHMEPRRCKPGGGAARPLPEESFLL